MSPAPITAFGRLQAMNKIKRREVFCPLNRMRAITTPLKVGDDLSLRTSIISPDLYDLELTRLIYRNTIFPDLTGNEITFDDFIKNMSFIDRKILLWGIFNSTYNTFGKYKIRCDKCTNKEASEFEDEILADQVIHEDSITPWDIAVPFIDYIYPVEIIVGVEEVYKIVFDTRVPSIEDHLNVLKLLPLNKIKENFEKFGSITSRSEDLTSITKYIKLYKSEDDLQPDIISEANNIHYAIHEHISLEIGDKVIEEYNLQFKKFFPKFYKKYECKVCKKDFEFDIDPEVSLFRQFFRA